MKFIITWAVRLVILVPLLLTKRFSERIEMYYDDIEYWLEDWNSK